MCFDLTKTQTQDRFLKFGEPEFEVELEITNFQHISAFLDSFPDFNKIVRRFIQNAASLMHIVNHLQVSFADTQAKWQAQAEKELLRRENEQLHAYLANYGGHLAPLPIVGDYLQNVPPALKPS